MAIRVQPHKNGKLTMTMDKGDYRLIRLMLQHIADRGTDADLRDRVKDLLLPRMPAIV